MRLLLVAISVLLASCSSSTDPSEDRLVILRNGDVVTIDRDGSNPQTIAEGTHFQPVWSPDRALLAFTQSNSLPAIAVARLSDGEVFTSVTDTFPFYYSWSARNELGVLRNGDDGLNLETVSFGDTGLDSPTVVAKGGPLYYSWSPDGGDLVAHVGVDQLLISDRTQSEPTSVSPGTFTAPAWTERGIFAIAAADDGEALVLIDSDGIATPLATVGRSTTLLPNRDASLVAVQTLAPQQQFQSAAFQTTPRVPANRLVILDTATGDTTTIADTPVLAYFWSPADNSLLILDVLEGPTARWSVWSEGAKSELVRFSFEPTFLTDFLPFFDQYAQSVSLWSPSGDAIAFPGSVDGRSGIWVQEIDGDPTWISDGTWVSWAP